MAVGDDARLYIADGVAIQVFAIRYRQRGSPVDLPIQASRGDGWGTFDFETYDFCLDARTEPSFVVSPYLRRYAERALQGVSQSEEQVRALFAWFVDQEQEDLFEKAVALVTPQDRLAIPATLAEGKALRWMILARALGLEVFFASAGEENTAGQMPRKPGRISREGLEGIAIGMPPSLQLSHKPGIGATR